MKIAKRILYIFLALPLLFLCLADCDGPTDPTYDGPWEKVKVPEGIGYKALDFLSPANGWVAGGWTSGVGHWDGNKWTIVKEFDYGSYYYGINDIKVLADDDIWLCGAKVENGDASPGIFVHYDGINWEIEEIPGLLTALGIWMFDDGTGWGGGAYGVYFFNGNDWTEVDDFDANTFYFNSKTDGWACGLSSIYHWDGTKWTKEFSDYSVWFKDIFFTSPDDGWAVSGGSASGAPYQYHWDGTEWTRIDDETLDGKIVDAIHFVDSDWGWAINGNTYFFDGNKWTEFEDDSSWDPSDIYCINKNDVWISQITDEYFLHFTGF